MAEDDSILGRSLEDFFSNLVEEEPVKEPPRRRRLAVVLLVLLAAGAALYFRKAVEAPPPPTPEKLVLSVSPERILASAALGYLSFLVGIPWVAGLSDNAILGVAATLSTLLATE